MKVFDFFKKKGAKVVTESVPTEPVKVPVINGKVDLMAADPISSTPVMSEPVPQKKPEIEERTGLEQQIMVEPPREQKTPILVATEEPPAPKEEAAPPVMDVFSMALPLQPEIAATPKINNDEVAPTVNLKEGTEILDFSEMDKIVAVEKLESLDDVKDDKPTKFDGLCPECGAPNDPLNKYCIACGKAFD